MIITNEKPDDPECNDYIAQEEGSAWIEVGPVVLHVIRLHGRITVHIYKLDANPDDELGDPLDSATVAESDIP